MPRLLNTWILCLVTSACGAAHSQLPACKGPRQRAGFQVMTASEPDTGPDARVRARYKALAEGLGRLGITVGSDLSIRKSSESAWRGNTTQESGSESVNETISVKLASTEVRESKVDYCRDGDEIQAHVWVPDHEWGRIAREKTGATWLAWQCESKPSGACGQVEPALRKLAESTAGLKLQGSAQVRPDAKLEEILQQARTAGAARVMLVKLSAEFRTEDSGVLYAWSEISASLLRSDDGVSLKEARLSRPAKGAVMRGAGNGLGTPAGACMKSLSEGLENLSPECADWASTNAL